MLDKRRRSWLERLSRRDHTPTRRILARWSVGRARLALNQDTRRRFDSYRASLRDDREGLASFTSRSVCYAGRSTAAHNGALSRLV